MTREADGQRGGEGLQVPGLGQLRYKAFRVDVHPLLTYPRAEVKVEAALEDLVDELGVHGHVSEGVKGLGHELGSVLRVQELPGGLLLLRLEGTISGCKKMKGTDETHLVLFKSVVMEIQCWRGSYTTSHLSGQVLLWWVVTLRMTRELGLGGRDVGEAGGRLGGIRLVVVSPEEVDRGLLGLLILGLEPTIANRPDELDDPVRRGLRINMVYP